MKFASKVLITAIVAIMLLMTANSVTIETAENANSAEASVLECNAVSLELKPGYNIWTGTTAPLDFENIDLSDFFPLNNPKIVETGDAQGKALYLNGTNTGIRYYSDFFDLNRPMYLNYTAKASSNNTAYVQAVANLPEHNKTLTEWSWNVTIDNWSILSEHAGNSYREQFVIMHMYENMTNIYFGANGHATEVYVDDLVMIPFYKVSYNLGEGIGYVDDEYFYDNEYTLTVDPAVITAPQGYEFSHWVDKNGNIVTNTVVPTPGEDIELTAVYKHIKYPIGTPGINLLSGTSEIQDFENCDISDFTFTNWDPSISSATIVDDEENGKSLCITGQYTSMIISGINCEAERPLYFVYDYKTVSRAAYILRLRANAVNGTDLVWSVTPGSDNWSTLPDQDGFRKIDVTAKGVASVGDTMPNIYWGISGKVTDNVYLDNAAIIPYYKVTYMNWNGSAEIKSEYFFRDSAGNIMTSYKPYGEDELSAAWEGPGNKIFVGWSEENNATTADASVSLAYKDIILYPVYIDKTDAVKNIAGNEIRFDTVDGTVVSSIRFKSAIAASEKNTADEYGFIVTRKTYLDTMANKAASDETLETDLTFDFKYNGNPLFVSGAAYTTDDNGKITLDKCLGEDENGYSIFATVLTGIKNSDADQVNEVFVARPYVKFTKDGKQYVFYGETAENSLVKVAKTVDASELPTDIKANIETIVALEK